MVGLIICLVALAATLVYTGWELIKTRKALEVEQGKVTAERQALETYKDKCYCKEIV